MQKSHTADWASDAPTPAQLAEFFRQIQSGRVTKVTLQAFLRNGTPSPMGSAYIVMRNDIIFPDDVMTAWDVDYTTEQRKHLADTIPSVEQLKWCKENGYAVVAGPPTEMSLLDIRSAESSLFYTKTEGWYANQPFATNDKVSCRWLAIRKTEVPNSLNKKWDAQQKLLSEHEEVPNASEMSWFITTYYKVRGVRLFEKVYVRTFSRTFSVSSGDDRVGVGYFDEDGLFVDACWDDFYDSDIGVSASRKF